MYDIILFLLNDILNLRNIISYKLIYFKNFIYDIYNNIYMSKILLNK